MTIPISLLLAHFVGDFLLQSDAMAVGKSKSLKWLTLHVLIYSLCFVPWGLPFVLMTFATHFLTDAMTSRITAKLWFFERLWTGCSGQCNPDFLPNNHTCWKYVDGRRHWFFVMVGLDQLIHFATLALTFKLVS